MGMRTLLDKELEKLRQEIQGERPLSERKLKLQAQIDEVKGKLEKNVAKVVDLKAELSKVQSFVDSQTARLSALEGDMQLLVVELEPVDQHGLDSTEQSIHSDMQALRIRMAEHRRSKAAQKAATPPCTLLQLGDATAFPSTAIDLDTLDIDELMDDQLDTLFGIFGEEGSAELAGKRTRMREALKISKGASSGIKKGNLKAA